MKNYLKKFITDPAARAGYISKLDFLLSDKRYLKKKFRQKFGYKLNLKNPETFNEKLQWLKIYDRKPEYTRMVDKYEAKKFVAQKIGEEYIIPTLGVWDAFDEIDFDALPDQFVLKCTHDSGGVTICRDKSKLDREIVKMDMNARLKRNYYWPGREWPYKNVPPRIIAEEYLENNEKEGLHDYKVWCFNGEPLFVQYISGRAGNCTYEGFYDRNWQFQNFTYLNPMVMYAVPKPGCLDELLELSKKLSKDTSFLRCDFYILPDGQIKFGEMTFYPMCGMEHWHPEKMDRTLGDKIVIK